ncbi:MAG TPA: I78 family peptidase inhibitor [Sphingomicrobium sp.]|nr:I78 family peptidase inhibitor [Sphingomicrobium sp.]
MGKSSIPSAALGLIPLSLLAIAACSTSARPLPPANPEGAMCTAVQLNRYKGQPRSTELGQRIKAESGARTLRWLPKGTITTMEYREDRVNVRLDENGRVEAINCG